MLELLVRIEKVLERNGRVNSLIQIYDVVIDTEKRTVTKDGQEVYLKPMEYECLLLFVRHKNKALTRKQILGTLWGMEFEMGTVSGLCAIFLLSSSFGANTTTGNGFEMDAIAMAVFGGISSTGGKGNIAGGVIAAFIIVCLRVGLGQQNVHAQVILLIIGALLIAAVALPNIIGQVRRTVKSK